MLQAASVSSHDRNAMHPGKLDEGVVHKLRGQGYASGLLVLVGERQTHYHSPENDLWDMFIIVIVSIYVFIYFLPCIRLLFSFSFSFAMCPKQACLHHKSHLA